MTAEPATNATPAPATAPATAPAPAPPAPPAPPPRPLDLELAMVVQMIRERRPAGFTDAACRRPEHRHLPWHGPRDPDGHLVYVPFRRLRQICADCPVLDACQQWVATDASTDRLPGFLAGMTQRHRRDQRRRQANPPRGQQ